MLYLTSFGFGAVGYTAILQRQKTLGIAYLILYGTSILHHANYTRTDYIAGPWVARIDRLLSKIITAIQVYNVLGKPVTPRMVTCALLGVVVGWIYYGKLHCSDDPYQPNTICDKVKWHSVMHILGVFIGFLYLSELKRLESLKR